MTLPVELTALHKLRVGGILRTRNMAARERRQAVWRHVYQTEIGFGTRLISTTDRRIYINFGLTNEIHALPPHNKGGDRVFGYLYELYGLDRMDPATNAIYEQFRCYAVNEGLRTDLRRFAAYDAATKTVYLSAYNGRMWRIDGENVPEQIQNGEDNVFFLDDDEGIGCEPEYGDNGLLFSMLTDLNYEKGPSGITPEMQRRIMIVWLFALAFPDLIPDKPVILLEGLKGSGKTSAPLLIQLALMGVYKIMAISKDQEKDFGVLLQRAPIAVLDNLDTYVDWIPDKIAQYATMGSFPKRKLFSDDEEIKIKPHSFVAVTSRNPTSLRRDDVADRLLIIRLKRYEQFRKAERLISEIKAQRAKLLGEYLYHVDRIVEAIRAGALEEERVETWRMASFAAFARVVGRVFEWPDVEVQEMLDRMQDERDIFEGEGDSLVEIMSEWIAYKVRGEPSNIGREFALTELFRIFSTIASNKGITFYKHHNRLAERLSSSYVTRHFRVESRLDEKTGTRYYKLWRLTDPVLESVTDEPTLRFDDPPPPSVPKIRVIMKGR